MALDGRGLVLARELDSGLQESQSQAGSPVSTVNGKARDPPDSGLVGQYPGESLVGADAWERRTGPYASPSSRMTIDVRDEPGRHRRLRDLPVQRLTIIWSSA
jgi:hypothetical protein